MNLRKLILSIIVMASVLSADASVRTWESAERFPVSVEQVAQPDDISVAVYEGYVYVFVRQQTHVKLFTLLGQVIVQDTLALAYIVISLHPGAYICLKPAHPLAASPFDNLKTQHKYYFPIQN